jgi:hypothetical protein
MANMRPPAVPEQPVPILTEDELKALPKAASKDASFYGKRDEAILRLFIDSGCRLSECAGLGVEDLNLDTGTVALMGKGRRVRHAPIGNRTVRAIDRYLRVRARHQDSMHPAQAVAARREEANERREAFERAEAQAKELIELGEDRRPSESRELDKLNRDLPALKAQVEQDQEAAEFWRFDDAAWTRRRLPARKPSLKRTRRPGNWKRRLGTSRTVPSKADHVRGDHPAPLFGMAVAGSRVYPAAFGWPVAARPGVRYGRRAGNRRRPLGHVLLLFIISPGLLTLWVLAIGILLWRQVPVGAATPASA